MCGIFAYLGSNPEVLKLLIEALQRLEYRGYDSAGIAIHDGNEKLLVEKSAGKVSNLRDLCKSQGERLSGSVGIAHTRWATHGRPTDRNSHPHLSQNRSVAVVHNGIIENYAELKKEMQDKGYVFSSETDTEVLAVLVDDMRKELDDEKDLPTVVSAALDLCVGTFGAVFLFGDQPDLLIGARRGSPLILGLGQEDGGPAYFLASDACAIVQHTRDVIYVNDGETVELSRKGYKIHDTVRLAKRARQLKGATTSTDGGVENPIVRLEMRIDEIEKGGYDHFMLKEIYDQSNSLQNCLRGRLIQVDAEKSTISCGSSEELALASGRTRTTHPSSPKRLASDYTMTIGGLEHQLENGDTVGQRMLKAGRVVMCACGTSWHSALIGEYLFEQMARIPVEVEYASEFRYRKPLIRESDVIIGISQSGETADTLEAIRLAAAHGATTFGIVNVVGSTIARETIAGMYIHAGPEVGVASTKAFTGQVLSLFLVAMYLAKLGGTMSEDEFQTLSKECLALPETVEKLLTKQKDLCFRLSKEVRLANNFLFLGRGLNFPVALEGALKLKEISYIHAEGYPAAEMKHGPIALIDQFMPVVVIAPRNDPTYIKVKANIEEVHARSGSLIIITDEGNHELDSYSEYVIYIPTVDQYLQSILNVIPLQLMSYYVAKFRGCEIDQPRNLAKSVTVE
ncbi:unnamed protein product [Amoebophrya sp. A25]|nr:unnamed protein product [Amoebophrya sp. A25]|eukprot:GSA25T00005840001.1